MQKNYQNLRRFHKCMSILILIVLVTISGCKQRTHDPFVEARAKIKQLMELNNIASFQVAVAKDGKLIYEEAFGLADVQEKIPATKETMYQIASIEKPFVSTALMMLTERGKINLNAPVNNYLDKEKLIAYQGSASDATVARLMLHVSGMAYGYYICNDSIPVEKRRTNTEILALAGVLVYPPGTEYEYTNYGYGLFGDIVQKAANGNIKEFITKEIIVPLGLNHTKYFRDEPAKGVIATQNVKDGYIPFNLGGDGYSTLYSTAGDLARFGMFHLKNHLAGQKPLLSDSSIDLLRTYKEPGVKYTTRTLAWDIQNDYGYDIIMHGGGGPGIHNYLYIVPSENLVIAYMSNAQYASSTPVLLELLYAAIPDFNFWNQIKGRGWPKYPKIDTKNWKGEWNGQISGPKGTCQISVTFNELGIPKLRINSVNNSDKWIFPNREGQFNSGKACYRFDACIPYLLPYAKHDEIIFIIKQDGNHIIGSASAAKEKDFGKDENFVLPQYIELIKVNQ